MYTVLTNSVDIAEFTHFGNFDTHSKNLTLYTYFSIKMPISQEFNSKMSVTISDLYKNNN